MGNSRLNSVSNEKDKLCPLVGSLSLYQRQWLQERARYAAIVNDWQSQIVAGMETALVLWEARCAPSLLRQTGTWTNISTTTEKELNKIRSWFLRLLL